MMNLFHDRWIKFMSHYARIKVNQSGAEGVGSIDAEIQGKDIIITEAIVHQVLKFEDQTHHPTTFGRDKVMKALRKMSYVGDYPTVLKKLFPPY
ncbi:hypothetical protein Hanom_Chr14g01278021 [Helianthus anomalus]